MLHVQYRKEWEEFNPNIIPEANIAPENRPSQKVSNPPTIHFHRLLLLVSGKVFGLNIKFLWDFKLLYKIHGASLAQVYIFFPPLQIAG